MDTVSGSGEDTFRFADDTSDQDPYGGRPAAYGRTVADAATEIEKSASAHPRGGV
ncbi:hypothetical protein [Actinoplanes derwentensis]|uniref:hypothetical protein n=1 Tax=Actinoplanes derwentensis TaxID=113562 RepID=UPI0012FD2A2B|nr:hypothetical protein [Actinoplanes derwentensis]